MKTSPIENIAVNDIDSKLVLLMGLSQGGYLAAKFAARQPIQITTFVLNDSKNLISVFGDNFGDTAGIIKMDDKILDVKDGGWTDTCITLKLLLLFTDPQKITVITSDGQSCSQKYNEELIP